MARGKYDPLYKGLVILILVVIVFLLLQNAFDFSMIMDVEYIRDVIRAAGPIGPALFIIVMAVAIVISPIPSLPLDAAAGLVWGPYKATLYAVVGAEIGAVIAFLIARNIGRTAIENLFHKKIKFLNTGSDMILAWIVFVARLFPFFQFDIVSYGAGITKMKMRHFAVATFFGMIPMTFVFAKFGQGIFMGSTSILVFSGVLIILLFAVPYLISKYNIFGLKRFVSIKHLPKKK